MQDAKQILRFDDGMQQKARGDKIYNTGRRLGVDNEI